MTTRDPLPLTLGIAALATCWMPGLGCGLGAAAIGVSIARAVRATPDVRTLVGFALGSLAVAVNLLVTLWSFEVVIDGIGVVLNGMFAAPE
jgi:hypothetical protein